MTALFRLLFMAAAASLLLSCSNGRFSLGDGEVEPGRDGGPEASAPDGVSSNGPPSPKRVAVIAEHAAPDPVGGPDDEPTPERLAGEDRALLERFTRAIRAVPEDRREAVLRAALDEAGFEGTAVDESEMVRDFRAAPRRKRRALIRVIRERSES